MLATTADSRLLVKFLNVDGECTGTPLEIPTQTNVNQLQVSTKQTKNAFKYYQKIIYIQITVVEVIVTVNFHC